MNRDTLIRRVATELDEPLGIVEQIVDATFRQIMSAVQNGGYARIEFFGAWETNQVPAKGSAPAYRQVRFRAAHQWRKQLNKIELRDAAE